MAGKMKAIGRTVKSHRLLFVFLLGIFTIGVIAGTYAVSGTETFSGQIYAGDHAWWTDQGTQTFCERCHQDVASDISTNAHKDAARSSCTFCHSPAAGDHAAKTAACTDCHSSQGSELASDAHAGILTDTGETATNAARTCQSCHTHAAVNITTTPGAAIELTMTP